MSEHALTLKPEREAAPQRSSAPLRLLQRRCACGAGAGLGAECQSCAERRALSLPASVERVLAAPGQALDPATRDFMEQRFGADFSGVRVHDNSSATQSSRDMNAEAYTVGQDIVFDHGRYQPGSESGKQLLAHELAHTLQQQGPPPLVQRTRATTTSVWNGKRTTPPSGPCPACRWQSVR